MTKHGYVVTKREVVVTAAKNAAEADNFAAKCRNTCSTVHVT